MIVRKVENVPFQFLPFRFELWHGELLQGPLDVCLAPTTLWRALPSSPSLPPPPPSPSPFPLWLLFSMLREGLAREVLQAAFRARPTSGGHSNAVTPLCGVLTDDVATSLAALGACPDCSALPLRYWEFPSLVVLNLVARNFTQKRSFAPFSLLRSVVDRLSSEPIFGQGIRRSTFQ